MSQLIKVNDGSFEAEVLKAKVSVLVDFHAEAHCSPCRALKPVLVELAGDIGENGKIVAVDVTVNEQLASKYDIQVVPTLIVFQGGREVSRMVGLKSRAYLRETLAV